MACDPEGYEVFADLLDNVIKDYHKFPMDQPIKHPAPDFGDLDNLPFGDLDPANRFIISTRVRLGRSADGFAYPPLITAEVSYANRGVIGLLTFSSVAFCLVIGL
jgi:hypothetical protein